MGVEELGGERASERVDGGLLLGGEVGEALGGARSSAWRIVSGLLLQGDDGGDRVERSAAAAGTSRLRC